MPGGWGESQAAGFTITSSPEFRAFVGRANSMLRRVLFLLAFAIALTSCSFAASAQAVPDVFVTSFKMDAYPPLARQANVAGDVTAVLHLNGNGSVAAITDVNGPELLRGEVDLVKTWEFVIPDRKPKQLAIILRYSLKGEARREASTMIRASLPYLIEITTNPSTDSMGVRKGKRNPDIPRANTCFRCG